MTVSIDIHTVTRLAHRTVPRWLRRARSVAAAYCMVGSLLPGGSLAASVLRSWLTGRVCDGDGEPVPWWTWGAIKYLEHRIPHDARVLEWGAGYSTVWLASRAASVVSIEHDAAWADWVRDHAPGADVRTWIGDVPYDQSVKDGDGPFDIVVVDAGTEWMREKAIRRSERLLSVGGVWICDNSDVPGASCGKLLSGTGWRELPFAGLSPATPIPNVTSIFYHGENCLGI